jgi:hypothetical protein
LIPKGAINIKMIVIMIREIARVGLFRPSKITSVRMMRKRNNNQPNAA